jgi:hypothetical protein
MDAGDLALLSAGSADPDFPKLPPHATVPTPRSSNVDIRPIALCQARQVASSMLKLDATEVNHGSGSFASTVQSMHLMHVLLPEKLLWCDTCILA